MQPVLHPFFALRPIAKAHHLRVTKDPEHRLEIQNMEMAQGQPFRGCNMVVTHHLLARYRRSRSSRPRSFREPVFYERRPWKPNNPDADSARPIHFPPDR